MCLFRSKIGQPTLLGIVLIVSGLVGACNSEKQEISQGEELAPAILGGGGGVQSEGETQVIAGTGTGCLEYETVLTPIPRPIFNIVPVVQIVDAIEGIPGWTDDTKLPLSIGSAPIIGFNDVTTDRQIPFHFDFTYPPNNYQFTEAHLVIDTQRTGNTGTEAIFIDGVMTGVPVGGWTIPANIDHDHSRSGDGTNEFFMNFSASHYKDGERNSNDFKLADLLTPSPVTSKSALSDGRLNVVISDDTPVFEARLVMKGLTIASDALTCSNSSSFSFENVYVHNDSNSTGQVAFTGTVGAPYEAYGDMVTYDTSEFYFDAPLPLVDVDDITIATAELTVTAKKEVAGTSAIIVNGVGISQTGFDRSTANAAAVDEWDDDATAKFDTWIASVTTGGGAATLDLFDLLGADKVKELLAQGKLNIALGGSLHFNSGGATSGRTTTAPVSGPELVIDGTYFAEICNVPNDPDSPLGEGGFVEPEIEYESKEVCKSEGTGEDTVTNDGAGPVFGSIQALDITSTSANIVWASDEGSTSSVAYGVGNTDTETTEDTTMTTFHQVALTGLAPYKFYTFQVMSTDKFGNKSISAEQVFRTLR
jgi:hypothetical protein